MKDMDRRRFLASLGQLAACTVAAPALGQSPSEPNIIFILADDWGWGDLGCYGNERIRTPHIDGLAREGIRFTQFYQAAAVCSPSRASCMTGLFTPRHGVHSHMQDMEGNRRRGMPLFLDPNRPMLARLLKRAGYATAHFGKWHLTSTDDPSAPPPPAYGFDAHRLTVGEGSAIHLQPASIPGWNSWEDARPGPHWEAWRAEASFRIMDETIRFIREHRQQPFYVQAWLYDTHAVLSPTAGQMSPFTGIPMPYRIYYSAA
ncbi:sulfatase-like hydrolase/transferase [Acidobacteria bacterium AH-259-G07]|nr:sulfatase-like hydrolase/transferase [Acidobacteria bacterium AH-259-G07]